MRTAVQIECNGNPLKLVADLPSALAELALNLNDGVALGPLADQHPMLAAAGIEIGVAHRLAYLAHAEKREAVDVVLHDLDSPVGHDSEFRRYEFIGFEDPCAVVAAELMRAEDTEIDLVDFEELIAASVRGSVDRLVARSSPAIAVDLLREMRSDYGAGTSEVVLVDYEGIDLDGDVPAQVAARAVDAFDRAATMAFTDEVTAPAP